MTDADAQAFLSDLLLHGETLVWSQAATQPAGPESWVPAIGLSILATFMGAISIAAATTKRSPRMKAWQIWVCAALLCFLPAIGAAHFYAQIAGAATAAYGITNQRVIIATREPWLQVRSFGPDAVEMINRRDDTVSIDYGAVGKGNRGFRTHLRGLAEPERVELLIIEHVRGDGRNPDGANAISEASP